MNTELLGGSVFFDWLGRASWRAAVLAGLVLMVQWLFRKRLTSAWRYRLWLLVVIRLVLPFPPASLVSVFNIAQFTSGNPPVTLAPHEIRAGPPALFTRTERSGASDNVITPHHATAPAAPVSAEPALLRPPRAVSWSTILGFLPWVWAAGVLFIATRMAWQNFRFGQRLRRDATPVASSIQEQYAHCRSLLGVRQSVVLCETSLVRSPALYGFPQARLLLPRGLAEAFSADELRYVLLHELAHVKRRDLAMNWLMALLQALHWFNPCLWLAFARMRLDRELACDALALSCARDDETTRYGETIIRLLEGMARGAAMPGLVGVLESRDQIRERIRMIAAFKRPGRWSAMAVLLMLGLGVVGLTDASPNEQVAQQTSAAADGLASKDGVAPRSAVTNSQDRAKNITPGTEGQVEVHGRVTDDQDHPIEGATVSAGKRFSGDHQRTKTDTSGRFLFRNVKEDLTEFSVAAKGRQPEIASVKVRAEMEEIVFRLAAGNVIRARVQNEAGEALSGTHVILEPSIIGLGEGYKFSTKTDEDGRFEWDGAPKESVYFYFQADGYEQKRSHFLKPDQDNVVTLKRSRRVEGHVVDAGTDAPITKFRVSVGAAFATREDQFYTAHEESKEYNNPNGAFTIEVSEEQNNAAQAGAEGYSDETQVLPEAKNGVVTVLLRLKPSSMLHGIVVNTDGRRVAGATVAVTQPGRGWGTVTLVNGRLQSDGVLSKLAVTDEAGEFKIPAPPENGALAAASELGFGAVSLAEARTSGTVTLRPYGRVEGVLKVGDQPVVGQELMLESMDLMDFSIPANPNGYKTTTDDEGRFTIEQVPPRKANLVRLIKTGVNCWRHSHSTAVTFEPGQTVHLALGRTGNVVRGRVRFETPLPKDREVVTSGELSTPQPRFPQDLTRDEAKTYVESAEWKEKVSNYRRYVTKVETDGSMMVDSILPGTYTLRVTATGPGGAPFKPKIMAEGEMPVTVPADAGPTTTIALDELVLKPVSKP